MSKTAEAICREFEGCRLTAYKDSAGVYTIGYGHTSGVYAGQTITQEQAEAFLVQDLENAFSSVDSLRRSFSKCEREALASFTFNCGSGNLRRLCENRNFDEIGNAITLYVYAGGVKLAGLVRRRQAEKNLYFYGDSEVSEEVKTYDEIPMVKSGVRGPIVSAVQAALVNLGYDVGSVGIDGICGSGTVSAIKAAQNDAGISVDGIAGPDTYEYIFKKE